MKVSLRYVAAFSILSYAAQGQAATAEWQSQFALQLSHMEKPHDELLYDAYDQDLAKALYRQLVKWPIMRQVSLEAGGYIFVQRFAKDDALDKSLLMSAERVNRSTLLENHLYNKNNLHSAAFIDRLSLNIGSGRLAVTLGRFPLDYSKTFVYRPNDLFGRFRSYQFDRSHKPGVDALRFSFPIEPLGELQWINVAGYEPVDKIVDDPTQERNRFSAAYSSSFLYYGNTIGGFFGSLFGGKYGPDYLMGGTIEGEFADVYGIHVDANQLYYKEDKGYFAEVALGLDRKIFDDWLLQFEAFHHGLGTDDPREYRDLKFDAYHPLNYWGRYYGSAMLSHTFANLMEMRAIFQQNFSDSSSFITLFFKDPLTQNIELNLTANIGLGKKPLGGKMRSEFGSYPQMVNLDLISYF